MRLSIILALTACTWFAGGVVTAAGQDGQPGASSQEPKALIASMIDAAGGAEAMAKIRNRHTEGSLVIPAQGMRATTSSTLEAPHRCHEKVVMEGFGTLQQGIDGDLVWAIDPTQGARILTGAERSLMLRLATLHPLLKIEQAYPTRRVAGTAQAGDRECLRLELTPDGSAGQVETWFVEATTFLVMRIELTLHDSSGKALPAAVDFSDYRVVDGVKVPFQVQVTQGELRIIHTTTRCTHNVEVPAGTFDVPAAVKALQEASAGAGDKPASQPAGGPSVDGKPADGKPVDGKRER